MARIGVIGSDHIHLFELVDRLVRSGAETVAHTADGAFVELYESWRTESVRRTAEELLADERIDLIVTAAVPNERAEIALAALAAGKRVLSDKPGLTTRSQLDAISEAIADLPGRPWTVLFTERFENRAINEAVRLAASGAIGTVVHVIGAGPHSMNRDQRPHWFWDPVATGGILVDIGAHQVDQFLSIAGAASATGSNAVVRAAAVGNVSSPEHPEMQDIGSMTLALGPVVGDHRLDYLTAPGLGTWGDVRLTIVGTTGTIEARANVDVAGEPGAEHLIVVDELGTRRVDLSGVTVDWAELLLADLADDGERLMTQRHVLEVCDLTLAAQEAATGWGVR